MSTDWREPFGITAAGPLEVTGSYEIWDAPRAAGGKAIRCLRCLRVSCHPSDVAQHYCVNCHVFHDEPTSGRIDLRSTPRD